MLLLFLGSFLFSPINVFIYLPLCMQVYAGYFGLAIVGYFSKNTLAG